MGTKKKFTPEELKHLQATPYTLRVTADSISYTLAFKEAYRFRGYAKGVRGIHMLTWPSSIAGRPFLMSKSNEQI